MRSRTMRTTSMLALVACVAQAPLPAGAQTVPPAGSGSPPACHGEPAADATAVHPRFTVATARYDVPDVALVDASGSAVSLRAFLDTPDPVVLNFVFTTCTTICPVMTATFAHMRRELGDAGSRLRLVSISIDPDYDRPAVLREYAARFGAGWTFLTGDGPDVELALRAFGVYAGSKMNHRPVTLLKKAGQDSWVRIEGLASGGDLAHEVQARLLD